MVISEEVSQVIFKAKVQNKQHNSAEDSQWQKQGQVSAILKFYLYMGASIAYSCKQYHARHTKTFNLHKVQGQFHSTQRKEAALGV